MWTVFHLVLVLGARRSSGRSSLGSLAASVRSSSSKCSFVASASSGSVSSGGAALFGRPIGVVTKAVVGHSLRLFTMLRRNCPTGRWFLFSLACHTGEPAYYLTSLDSRRPCAERLRSPARPSKTGSRLRGIAAIAFLLLSIAGESVVGTVQTGISGAPMPSWCC